MKLVYILLFISLQALAVEKYELIIQNHIFIPNQLIVPSNTKFKLVIHNQDKEPEEFESFDLRREKIIPANSSTTININSLEPGSYSFFGDFHSDTAQGTIIAK